MTEFELQFLPPGPKRGILSAALSLAVEQGPLGLNLASIAREAQISRPKLAYHYNDLETVFADLCECWAQSGQSVTLMHLEGFFGAPAEKLIAEIVVATFRWRQQCPFFSSLTLTLNQVAHRNPKVAKIMELTTDKGLSRIEALVTQINPSASSPRLVAQTIHLNLIGGFLYHLSTRKMSDQKMINSIQKSIALILKNQ